MLKGVAVKLAVLLSLFALVACSLPRGAPTRYELINSAEADQDFVAVVPITRNNVKAITNWPVTGWHGHYHWFERKNGPETNIIRTGDRVSLAIWDNQENSLLTDSGGQRSEIRGLIVSPSGTIFVPYLDQVAVRGLTPSQARELIQSKLVSISPSAQVLLDLDPGKNNSVDLVAGVRSPGTYKLPSRNFSIMSLLALGGGISPDLDNPLIRLIRDGQTYEIRSSTLFADSRKNVILRGGDQVIVDEDQRFFLTLGAVEEERPVVFEKEQINALEALTLVNGLQDARANVKGLMILRRYEPEMVKTGAGGPDKEQVIFTIDLTKADGLFAAQNFQINPHDTILATESELKPVEVILALFGTALALSNAIP